jgi:hypothetical protein
MSGSSWIRPKFSRSVGFVGDWVKKPLSVRDDGDPGHGDGENQGV